MEFKNKLKCVDNVLQNKQACCEKECRYWIDYQSDLNCTYICVKNNGALKLQEIGNRLHVSAARIKQIKEESFKKLMKKKLILQSKE